MQITVKKIQNRATMIFKAKNGRFRTAHQSHSTEDELVGKKLSVINVSASDQGKF